jgi:hypothetical protein
MLPIYDQSMIISTYDKFVGWCVHSWLNYPIYMNDSDAFRLEHGKKVTLFDLSSKAPSIESLIQE